jgi:hypothetical protein
MDSAKAVESEIRCWGVKSSKYAGSVRWQECVSDKDDGSSSREFHCAYLF